MNINEPTNPFDQKQSKSRRRRANRQVIAALSQDERANYIDEVANRAAPTFDFFLFSLLSGAIIGFGYILDSPYILLLGALTAPVMAPLIGISLGTVLGSAKHFTRSLGGMTISLFLVLLAGALAGFAARVWLPLDLLQVYLQAQLTWPPFIVLTIGAAFTAATLVKTKHNPAVPSIALAYSLFLPLTAAGFGLGSGIQHLWPDGLVLFAIHLSYAVLVGAVTLGIMGFRPYTLFGYSIGGTILLIAIVLVIAFGGFGAVVSGNIALPTGTPTITPSVTSTLPPTNTPIPPTETFTPTSTPTKTLVPSITPTPSATPVEARLDVSGGAFIREEPNGQSNVVSGVLDGGIVIVLGEVSIDAINNRWIKIYNLEDGGEGWILEYLLVTATPSISPTETIQPTITPSVSP